MAGSLWIVWTIIGIIGGFMVGRLVPKIRSTAFAVCVGIGSYKQPTVPTMRRVWVMWGVAD